MKIKPISVTVFNRFCSSSFNERENWYTERKEGLRFYSDKDGEAAAEEAFVLTNAPEDALDESLLETYKEVDFKGPSLSVGDVVKVQKTIDSSDTSYYICKSIGWEKYEGDKIELLKYLLW